MIMFKSTYLAKHHHLSSVVYILCFVSAYLGVWFCWWGICFSLSLLDCPLLHQLRCYYKSSIFFCHLKRGFFFFLSLEVLRALKLLPEKNHRPAKLAKFASFLKEISHFKECLAIWYWLLFKYFFVLKWYFFIFKKLFLTSANQNNPKHTNYIKF